MRARYTVVPVARRSKINRGDSVEIEVYIHGYGDVDRNKLQFLHSQSGLIDSEEPGELVSSVGVKSKNSDPTPVPGERGLNSFEIDDWGTMTILNEGYFADLEDANPSEGGDIGVSSSDGHLVPVVGEASHDGHPPVLLRLNTDDDASPGDYELPVLFTYRTGDELRQVKDTVQIHVNTRVEQYRLLLEVLGLVSIAFTFLIFVVGVLQLL